MIATIALNETLRAAADRPTSTSVAVQRRRHQERSAIQGNSFSAIRSTVGNECKWHATEQQRGSFTLGACNAAFEYARSAKQAFRGHNLCWGNDNPAWLETGSFSTFELKSILEEHITSVMQGVKAAAGKSPLAWDVVNEATNSTAFFKPNRWYPAVPDYVDVAFRAARAADPDALLFYNDYGVAEPGGAKAEQMYAMVASTRARRADRRRRTAGAPDARRRRHVDHSDDIKGRSRAPASGGGRCQHRAIRQPRAVRAYHRARRQVPRPVRRRSSRSRQTYGRSCARASPTPACALRSRRGASPISTRGSRASTPPPPAPVALRREALPSRRPRGCCGNSTAAAARRRAKLPARPAALSRRAKHLPATMPARPSDRRPLH